MFSSCCYIHYSVFVSWKARLMTVQGNNCFKGHSAYRVPCHKVRILAISLLSLLFLFLFPLCFQLLTVLRRGWWWKLGCNLIIHKCRQFPKVRIMRHLYIELFHFDLRQTWNCLLMKLVVIVMIRAYISLIELTDLGENYFSNILIFLNCINTKFKLTTTENRIKA